MQKKPLPRLCHTLLVLLAAALCGEGRLAAATSPGWELVWADEFAQTDGSAPDPAKWGHDIGGNGWGNNELQYYTNRTKNARIEGGQLVIEAHEENYGGTSHTSARLLTRGKWATTHGRVETRLKVPKGQGLWPAFWMLGADIDAVSWPACGEIDIMEHVGRNPKEVFGTIHGPGYAGAESIGGSATFAADVADDFHVFAVEWDPALIRWFVDDVVYFTATPASLGGNPWVFEHPHFLLLNMAVGGNFAGPLSASTTFPCQLLVDYVRVYRRTAEPGANLLANPGFENSTLSPWTGYAAGGANQQGGYVESTTSRYYNGGNPGGSNVLTHSGNHVAKVFGDFTGTTNDNGFFQDLPAEAGSRWSAGGWALTHPQDLMSRGNSTWIEVTFRNAANTVLARHRSPVLTASTVTAGSWMNLAVTDQLDPSSQAVLDSAPTMLAPPGTTFVRYQIVFRQPAYDDGAMYFDDLSLVRLADPEPITSPGVLETPRIRVSHANPAEPRIQLSFPTEPGQDYEIAFKTDLTEAAWTYLENVTGDGTTKVLSYPLIGPRRFFVITSGP